DGERRHVERRVGRHDEIRDRNGHGHDAERGEEEPPASVVRQQSSEQHQPSAARPFCGNSPLGRFWMNRIKNTSTRIFASTAPTSGSSSLLTTPRPRPLTSVPHRFPTPPKTTTMNESTI